ncbi:sulfotransferase domain-containing protein, partial [Synechococcus sp. AH-224-G16]|nr:sulfotransferase domain-containing protein [Synechococcus sp. AH-224-G16]
SKNTDLTIEGFPRSANSFLEVAIKEVSAKPLLISHHVHARANIYRSIKLKVPCVVLYRNPVDAIVSFMEESNGRHSNPLVLLNEYNIFYETMPFNSRYLKFISFEDVVSNLHKTLLSVFHFANLSINKSVFDDHFNQRVMSKVSEYSVQRVGFKPAYNSDNKDSLKRNKLRLELRDKILKYETSTAFKKAMDRYWSIKCTY